LESFVIPVTDEDRLVSIEAFAVLADRSKETLKRLKREGKLPPALQISAKCVRWRLSDVRRWIAAKQQATPSK
jgi:predicted DNA-binding transcriptional regulator AlpA